jgi:phage repressor protein C with HTH and peptisase S24 domain
MPKKLDPRLGQLAARIVEVTEPLGSIDKAAEKIGIPPSSLGRMRRGESEPNVFHVAKIAEATNVSIEWLIGSPSPILEPGEPAVRVQKLDVRAAAGPGAVNGFAKLEEELEFPAWMSAKLGVTRAKLRLLRAHGDSMEPTIANGALLLFEIQDEAKPPEKGRRDPSKVPNDIFVFRMGGDLRVKRIHAAKGGVMLISDNPEYDPEFVRGADRDGFKIIGQVVWWCNWL